MKLVYVIDRDQYLDLSSHYPRPMKSQTAFNKLTGQGIAPSDALLMLEQAKAQPKFYAKLFKTQVDDTTLKYLGNSRFHVNGKNCNPGATLNKLLAGGLSLIDGLSVMRVLIDEHCIKL